MNKYNGIAYNLRLPPELKEKIQVSAKHLNRSMNADIVARLEESFEKTQSQSYEIADLKEQIRYMQMTIDTIAKTLSKKD